MKSVAVLTFALLGAVCGQDMNSIPQCGQNCVQGMINKQAELGCSPANGQPDASCLCNNANFSFGLRDCARQACGSEVEQAVVSYGVSYCQAAGVSIPTTVVSGSSSATGSASGSASGSATTESSSAITTSSFATTITSGDSTITTSAATTIFGVGGGAASSVSSAASEASGSVSSVASEASESASSVAESASSAASSIAGSASSAASSAAGEATGTSASEGFAPQMTAAPAAGFLAAAGLAAMLL